MCVRVKSDGFVRAVHTVPHSSTDPVLFSHKAYIQLLYQHSLCMSSATNSDTSICAQSMMWRCRAVLGRWTGAVWA